MNTEKATHEVESEVVEVLLLEDNPGDARLTTEALKEAKVRNKLHHLADGVEALAFLRRQGKYASAERPDLIVASSSANGHCSRAARGPRRCGR